MADPSLSEVMDGKGTPFEVSGVALLIRPLSPEEYDESLQLYRLAYRLGLNAARSKGLDDVPCSEAEKAQYEGFIKDAQQEFADAEEGSDAKRDAAERIGRLQRMLDRRTLAEEDAQERAQLAQDRFLVYRLLCDKDGAQLLDPSAKNFAEQCAALPYEVKEAARPAIWLESNKIRTAPFSLDQLRALRSS